MPTDQDSFCKISRFVERDIDLLIAEEICTNPEFSAWFVKQGGGGFECNHPAVSADISVVEDGSEADVSALFEDDDGNKLRLFIENKIAAQKMPEQLERYAPFSFPVDAAGQASGFERLLDLSGPVGRICPRGRDRLWPAPGGLRAVLHLRP